MSRRITTAVPDLSVLFLTGWLASLACAPACTPPPPKFDFNIFWAGLIGPFVLWSLLVRLGRLARPVATSARPRWPMLSAVLLAVGMAGCVLSLGCAPLEAHWATWGANDAFQTFTQLPSKWKLAGMAGTAVGLLGLAVARFRAPLAATG